MAFSVKTTTGPSEIPVPLADAKTWLRIDGSGEDAVVTRLVKSATGIVETYVRRALITQTKRLTLDGFPDSLADRAAVVRPRDSYLIARETGALWLPYAAPLQSVESVKYLDRDGDQQTLDASEYRVDDKSELAFIVPVDDADWPDSLNEPGAIEISYVCGYGDEDTDVPSELQQAILELTQRLYDRDCDESGCIDQHAAALMAPFRIMIP